MNVISRPLILAALGTLLTAMNALAQNAPVASAQSQTTPVSTPVAITLVATDADNDPLTFTWTDPVHGALSGTPPDLTYTPDPAYNGRDKFTFKAHDGSASSNSATVNILVNDAPTGEVRINLDLANEEMTRRTSVVLSLTAADDGPGPILMCISNKETCSTWMPFARRKKWRLARGNGTKTVYVRFRDKWRQKSSPVSDTILLDRKAPLNGAVAVVEGDAKLTLNWSTFDDGAGSGTVGYRAVFKKGESVPSCTDGTPVPGYLSPGTTFSPATTLEHTVLANGTPLVNGTNYTYRVCAIDAVGNTSSGTKVTGKPVYDPPPPTDTTPPTGTVTINGGAATTNSTSTTLTLTAADAGGGAIQMCISNTATCGNWTIFTATTSWTLAAGDGIATVNVWYRDQFENTSTDPNSDTIVVDTTAPSDGTVTVTVGGTQQLTLNWSGFTDTGGSGITGYQAVFQEEIAPSSCTAGAQVPGYDGTATMLVHDGLVDGTTYGYRICAIDAAGNISSGASVSGQAISMNCEECHIGNNPNYPLAPNVMGDGTNVTGIGTTPKPYDDGSFGYNVNGHGRDADTGAISHGNAINAVCADCHDISVPAGRHLDGVLDGRTPSSSNGNPFHLVPGFINSSPSSEWSAQVTFDNYCWTACHQGRTRDMRHAKDANPVAGAMQFGQHHSYDAPLSTPPPNMFYDANIAWLGAYNGAPYFALCITCHNPHGTNVVSPRQDGNNKMMIYRWSNPPVICARCHI